MWKKTNGTNTEPVEKPEDNINTSTPSDQDPYGIMKPLSPVLTENINRLKDIFKYDKSVIYRCFGNRHTESFHACIVFVSNMADHKDINENLIAPILQSDLRDVPKDEMIDYLKTKVIPSMDMKETEYMDSVLQSLFEGDTVLFVDGEDKALVIRSTDYAERQITEPEFEKVLEGPREGFVENLSVNLTLIRRRLKSPELKFKFKEVGTRTRTTICLCYLENLVNERVLNELENRIDKIDIDSVVGANVIAENIVDSPLSVFSTVGSTERPDVTVSKILEGRIAILVDGSSKVLTMPFVFIESFQTAEDYYTEYHFASLNRILRITSAAISIAAPSVYLALVTFHQEMIPTPLLLSISAARQGVPFPTIVEMLLLLFAFDLVREASARISSQMGQSITIVGALILGQAAVDARFFSSLIVIIVAITGTTGIMTPKLKGAYIIIRTLLLMLTAVMGIYGLCYGTFVLFLHLFSLRSLGVPFMMGLGSVKPDEIKDTVIRTPWWFMNTRSKLVSGIASRRQSMDSRKGKMMS
ncbi:MAG: spore germination protein [Clostridia bacterium]|jgi:spore germination protein KA